MNTNTLFDVEEIATQTVLKRTRKPKTKTTESFPSPVFESLFSEEMVAITDLSEQERDKIWDLLESKNVAKNSPLLECWLLEMVFEMYGTRLEDLELINKERGSNGSVFETMTLLIERIRDLDLDVKHFRAPGGADFYRIHAPRIV